MNSKKGGRGNDFPRYVSQTVGPEDRKIKRISFLSFFSFISDSSNRIPICLIN